ncbi:Nif3-like dinuclear metal center hexameric protein [Haloferula sargassicola]|uniref:GTP cyclohydrolase 1 type 2 homolog n=1 Tax=Haloferula sargassicola TaxID=490096 RepID=A0ABP9UI50_9BACT
MAELREIRDFLDRELRIGDIPDYSGAVNGLQLENGGAVRKVMAAVDASLPVVLEAVESGADLLLVHHGLFWQGAQPIVGGHWRKLKAAIEGGLAVYSAHLPLDVHPQWGNNCLLAEAIGFKPDGTFLEWKGLPVGLTGGMEIRRDELAERLERAVGGAVHVCPGGPERVLKVGLCTGGAGSQVAEAAMAGVDAFITGEGPHWSYPLAEEMGINVFYAGHYATETFGVRKLAEVLGAGFGIEAGFIDHPTGL